MIIVLYLRNLRRFKFILKALNDKRIYRDFEHFFVLKAITARNVNNSCRSVHFFDNKTVYFVVFFGYYLCDQSALTAKKYLVYHNRCDRRREHTQERNNEIVYDEYTERHYQRINDEYHL